MNSLRYNAFVFSPRYRLHRHVIFWTLHILLWALFWTAVQFSFTRNLIHMIVWLPAMMLYCYPLMYWFIPSLLLKGKYLPFILVVLCWAVAGWYLNIGFRAYIFIPFQEKMGFSPIVLSARQPGSYLSITTTAGITGILVIFKHWMQKQQDWLQMEKEKLASEIRLLKAQIHPHFLFNSLNNIYAFSLGQSPKTPALILRLSSLLSYMLYECKEEEVLLEKEINIMRDYIDLEKERYGNRIDISWSIQGDVSGKYIAPLLLLPFLENAFKHGASEQLEKPWLSVEISLEGDVMRCKMLNSKNKQEGATTGGIGIQNVQKRLGYLYPSKHELKLTDNETFFMVSLLIHLHQGEKTSGKVRNNGQQAMQKANT